MIKIMGNKGLFNRIFAFMMTLVILIGTMPLNGFSNVFAIEVSEYTFTVTDGTDFIADAVVTIFDSELAEVGNATTLADGKASFMNTLDVDVDYTYEVVKLGYETKSGAIDFTSETNNTDVTLTVLDTVTVTGTITDGDNEPIEGATIQMDGYASYTVTSSAGGTFSIEGVYDTGGIYTITVNKDGYKTQTRDTGLGEDYDFILVLKETQPDFTFEDVPTEIPFGASNTYAVSGLGTGAITYSSSNTDIAQVDSSSGKLTTIAVGSVRITATKESDADYLEASTSYDITIVPSDDTNLRFDDPAPSAINYEEPFTFTNPAMGSGSGTITYTSSADTVATVDVDGILTILKPGTVTITASQVSDGLYDAAMISYQLVINKVIDTEFKFINATPSDITYGEGVTYSNTASGIGTGTGTVSYSSSNEEVATVDSTTGLLTTKKPGLVSITATQESDEYYQVAEAVYSIIINKAEDTSFVFNEAIPATICYGDTYTNLANGLGSGAITYSSSDDAIAQVDSSSGKLTTVAVGSVTITATKESDDFYHLATTSYDINIEKSTDSKLVFEFPEPAVITYGETYTNPASGFGTGEVSYYSTNVTIATVDNNGDLTILKSGTVTITAYQESDDFFEANMTSYIIHINKSNDSKFVFENKTPSDITHGDPFTNTASGLGTGTISYSSNDNSVASVDINGKIKTKKAGTVTITATQVSDDFYENAVTSYSITINKAGDTSLKFEKVTPSDIVYGDNFTNALISVGTGKVSYYSTNVLIATVDGNGILTILKSGTVTITAIKASDDSYNESTTSYTITILKANQTLGFDRPAGDTIVYEENLTYTNLASSMETTNSILYSIDSGSEVATINPSNGKLEVLIAGTITVRATIEGDDCYNSATKVYTLTVLLSEQIGFEFTTPNPIDVIYGKDFTNATIGGSGTGEITYKIKSGVNATINSATGQLTITNIGTLVIEATKAGDQQYKPAIVTYTINVVYMAAPTIAYTLTGNHINGTWFTGNVTINPPTGYQISLSNSLEATNIWQDKLGDIITQDGKHVTAIYLKNSLGISERIDVSIWKDQTNPTGTISGAIRSKKQELITIGRSDVTSGITSTKYFNATGKLVYTIAELDNLASSKWVSYNLPFYISTDGKTVVYAKITDAAGNYIYVSTGEIILDMVAPIITLTPDESNVNQLYNSDVTVNVAVNDPAPFSGIKAVSYRVESDGVVTQQETLFTYEGPIDLESEFIGNWNDKITISSIKNNSNNVVLFVTSSDNMGNVVTSELPIKIDTTKPTISVSYTNGGLIDTIETRGYYNGYRTATIVITERNDNFNPTSATNAISILAKDLNNNTLAFPEGKISTWSTTKGATPDEDTHTATITYDMDANYTFHMSYADKAGNLNTPINYGTSEYPEEFTIDTVAPTASISISSNIWYDLVSTLTFGLWSDSSVSVLVTQTDKTSPVKSVEYYKTSNTAPLEKFQLDNLDPALWQPFTPFTIESDEQFVIYVKITDFVGNYSYISSNGYIVDKTKSSIVLTASAPNEHGFHKGNIEVGISVIDPAPYSGMKEIKYRVETDGVITKQDNLFSFTKTNPTQLDLVSSWSGNINVNANENNSDHVIVYVTSTDNAGNEYTSQIEFKVSTKLPEIFVSYADSGAKKTTGYYDEERTATITIVDRTSNFDGLLATNAIQITAVDVKGTVVALPIDMIPVTWSTIETSTPDGARHTATITYSKDANYTFDLLYTNKAGNSNVGVDYGKALSPTAFTVDTVNPTGSITVSDQVWDELLHVLSFGLWSNKAVTISMTAEDETSLVQIQYYKTNHPFAKTSLELDALASEVWTEYVPFSINSNEQFVIYTKLTDYAGNITYLSSDGNIVDMSSANISLSPDSPVTNGFYNSNVKVGVNVSDPAPYSGIKEISYKVVADGSTTQSSTLYSFSNKVPAQSDLLSNWSGSITVEASKNNSNNVEVFVTVKDNAGNEQTQSVKLKIDSTPPTIKVTFAENEAMNIVDGHGYFKTKRTATIVITERTANFNSSSVSGISISGWSTVEGSSPDAATHTATITYELDGKYTFGISYTDNAGNSNTSINYSNSVTPTLFTIDKVVPTGTITVGDLGVWKSLVKTLTFGLWSNNKQSVIVTAEDVTSPIFSIQYYKTSATKELTEEQLDALDKKLWNTFEPFDVNPNEQFTVYGKITDMAGNYSYLSSDGIILDNAAPMTEKLDPAISLVPVQPVNEFYTKDVSVAITVVDPIVGATYSGIKNITYEVLNMGVKTQSGELYKFTQTTSPTHSQLKQKWEGSIKVDKSLNNSNDVLVKVFVEDNAGKTSVKTLALKIDTTVPKVGVTYDNNIGVTKYAQETYFKQTRTATIAITERNFNSKDVVIKITSEGGTIPTISNWNTLTGIGNKDNTTHTATITYSTDGDYTFDVSYTDMAGNVTPLVDYGTSLAPTRFTIDKTIPVVTVSYDNNNAQNNNYFKSSRTATISVKEHNFDKESVVIKMSASDNGAASTVPNVSNWSSNGDVHTATIVYANDSLYRFAIEFTDKANNEATKTQEQVFYIDKTSPTVSIKGVVDESANNKDTIGFILEAQDTNFNTMTPVLTIVTIEGSKILKDIMGSPSTIKNGKKYTVENLSADGIYKLTCSIIDKAGNVCNEVTLFDTTNKAYTNTFSAKDNLVTFSVNRVGSTFELDASTQTIMQNYYVQNIDNSIQIIEINADLLTDYQVTLNGKILMKGIDYTVQEVNGNNAAWCKYTYSIHSSLFSEEGAYNLIISSTNKTGAKAYSDIKNTEVSFVIDRTKPEVIISGLMNGGRYRTVSQTVTLVPNDAGAKLYSLLVTLNNKDTLIDLSGEQLIGELANNSGKVTFEVPSDINQSIQIICTDVSGNVLTQEINKVTVSNEWYVLFYANKQLFYGSIAGVLALIMGITTLLVIRRKKSKKQVVK